MAQNVNINVNVNGKKAGASIDTITKSLGKLSAQSGGLSKANANLKQTGIISKVAAGGIKRLAVSVGGLVAVYAGFSAITSATRNLIDFNKAIAEVQTIARLTPKRLGEVKLGLLGISSATGKSAAEATRTFYQIQSAGIKDVDQAQKTLTASLKLSVGSLANAETTTLALTKAMALYGDELKGDPTKAADILFRGVELGQTRMEDLAAAIPQVLGPAKNLGLTFAEVTGAVASFSKRAGTTAIAVTQLQSILSGLAKKQGEAGKILGENANLFSIQSLKAKGLTKFLKDLTTAVGGSSTALFKLFGRKEAVVGALSAYADGFKDLGDTIEAAKINTGAADRAFQEIFDSIGGQIDVFRERTKNIILKFGITGEDSIVAAIKGLNKGLENFANNANEIMIRVKSLLISVGVIAFGTFALKAVVALKTISLQFAQMRASAAINLTGVKVGLKGFIASIAAAKFAVISFQAVASFGLTLVLTTIIEKLLTMEQQLGSWGRVWDSFALPAKIVFKEIELAIDQTILKFHELRLKGVMALESSIIKLGSIIGLNVKATGFENLKILVKQSGDAVDETTGALTRLEGRLDSIRGKNGSGDGSLLFRPPEKFEPFKLPGDRNVDVPLDPDATGGVPGAPNPADFAKAKSNVLAFNAEMNMIREQQRLLEDEEAIQIRVAQGDAVAVDFEALRLIELEKINIKFDAELEKTRLIQEADKRNQAVQKIGAKRELALQKTTGKQSVAIAAQTEAVRVKSAQNAASLVGAAGNLGAALAKDGSKAQFLIQKSAAIAGSIMATNLASSQALASASLVPGAGVALSTQIKAIGALNTATIVATGIKGFRTGGIVGGTPTGGRDSVLTSLEPREAVLTRSQQSRLLQLADGEAPNNEGGVMSAINNLANAIMGQSTSIEIDGREVALAMRDQRLSGVAI